jgi:hypothetical protein
MIVCGIELASSEARLVVLDGSKDSYSHISTSPPKVVLADDENPIEVNAFKETIFAFFRENHVGKIVIKKRNKRGGYAGGPVSFKLEGLIQLYQGCEVVLLSPQTISAAVRKHSLSIPKELNNYQQSAFETAFTGLE